MILHCFASIKHHFEKSEIFFHINAKCKIVGQQIFKKIVPINPICGAGLLILGLVTRCGHLADFADRCSAMYLNMHICLNLCGLQFC